MDKNLSSLSLPMWLAEDEKSLGENCGLVTSSKFTRILAKTIAVVCGTISLHGVAFIVTVNLLPVKDSRVLCPDFCEEYKMVLVHWLLPSLLLFGLILNILLWCGVHWYKPWLLTLWTVVYEMLLYFQIFFQMWHLVQNDNESVFKSPNNLQFLTNWLLPIILLWLHNNAHKIVVQCRDQMQNNLHDKQKRKYANLMGEKLKLYKYKNEGQSSRSTSVQSVDKLKDINHFYSLPKFDPQEFHRHFNSGRRSTTHVEDKTELIC